MSSGALKGYREYVASFGTSLGLAHPRAVTLSAGERRIDVVTRRNALQSRILAALGVDTSTWERPRIS